MSNRNFRQSATPSVDQLTAELMRTYTGASFPLR